MRRVSNVAETVIVYGLPSLSDSFVLYRVKSPVAESIVRKSPMFASFVGYDAS